MFHDVGVKVGASKYGTKDNATDTFEKYKNNGKEYRNPDYGDDDELTDEALRKSYGYDTQAQIKEFRKLRRQGVSERVAIYQVLGVETKGRQVHF